MSEYTIKTVNGSVARFDDSEDGLPLTNCEVDIVPKIETGTASGSVVTFSDGADNVPLKSCIVTVPPTLDGVSEIDVHHMNSNLLILNIESQVKNGLTLTVNPDGTIRVTGTATSNTEFVLGTVTRSLNTDYVLTGCPPNGSNSTYRQIVRYTKDGSGVQTSQEVGLGYTCKATTRPDANGFKISIYIYAEQTVDLLYKPMFRPATFYDPTFYKSTEFLSSTINLGRVSYGCEVDAIAGKGRETSKEITFSDLTWTYDSTYSRFLSSSVNGIVIQTGRTLSMLCDNYTVIDDGRSISEVTDMSIYNSGNSGGFYVHDARYTTVEDFIQNMGATVVCYPIATPEDFTVTPLSMRSQLDNNCIWSFKGETAVTYYKYGYSYEHAKIYSTNKNLFPTIADDTLWEDGSIDANTGRNTSGSNLKRTKYYIPVKGMTNALLCLSGYTNSGTTSYFRIYKYDKNMNYLSLANLGEGKYYIEDNVAYIRMRYYVNYFTWNDTQLEYIFDEEDSPTTYEPYMGTSVSTLNLNKVIHGGTVNVFKGTGISKYVMASFPDCSWTCITSYQSNFNSTNGIVSVRFGKTAMGNAGYALTTEGVVCNNFANNNRSVWNKTDRLNEIGYADGITINMHYSDIGLEAWTDNSTTTLAAWKSSELYLSGIFALIKAEPEPFTFTPIQLTSHSSNMLWSTEGDITVSYYSYIETEGRYLISGSTLTDIADAIREKTSIVGPINVNDFITDIMTIDDSAPDAEEVEF